MCGSVIKNLTLCLLLGYLNVNHVSCVDDGGLVEQCAENEIAFGCKRDGTAIAVREAWLHDAWSRVPAHKCQIPEYNVQFKKGSVLQHINKKCSLDKVCRFNVWKDIPGANEDEKRWKGGVIRIIYECIPIKSILETCGKKIEAQNGWIQNIGYPKYYLGPAGACTYTLIVDPGQKIKLSIIDLSLREIIRPAETKCTDYLSVDEGNSQLLVTCGESNRPIKITSHENVLNVTLHTSVDVYPKRGFLVTFTAIGCQTPELPKDGYLSHRDTVNAEFRCSDGYVFPNTMSRIQRLTCERDENWDNFVSDCMDLDDLLSAGNITEEEYRLYNGSVSASMFVLRKEVVYDIIVPVVLMSTLILGNVGILILIVLCRRRVQKESANLEELESIKANAEPTDIREPQPCEV